MKNLEILGLKNVGKEIDALHQFLADLHVFYANVRGYHWNVKGTAFFALHEEFEKIYDAIAEQIDEVAERLLQLSETPENNLEALAKKAKLSAKGKPDEAKKMVEDLLEDFQYILASCRNIAELSDEAGDTVTNDLVVGMMPDMEKKIWMFNAYKQAK